MGRSRLRHGSRAGACSPGTAPSRRRRGPRAVVEARAHGAMRMEGKGDVMRDGDVVEPRLDLRGRAPSTDRSSRPR
ncbi:MAG: hypothetical protein DI611_06940 [Brachybacterium faecium]|nr:MAG: hypothetical protein DI611_06940 [Brachybacterium faecium]